jgi:hypothetical protein
MNTQFPFSAQGVQDWQDGLYAAGQPAIDAECELIATDFVAWLSTRFGLTSSQTQFLISLGRLSHLSYGASIQNALQHFGKISLEKAERITVFGEPAQNPKVVYHQQRTKAQQDEEGEIPEDEELEVEVDFHIEYPDPE